MSALSKLIGGAENTNIVTDINDVRFSVVNQSGIGTDGYTGNDPAFYVANTFNGGATDTGSVACSTSSYTSVIDITGSGYLVAFISPEDYTGIQFTIDGVTTTITNTLAANEREICGAWKNGVEGLMPVSSAEINPTGFHAYQLLRFETGLQIKCKSSSITNANDWSAANYILD